MRWRKSGAAQGDEGSGLAGPTRVARHQCAGDAGERTSVDEDGLRGRVDLRRAGAQQEPADDRASGEDRS
jgi:hypothetical protein